MEKLSQLHNNALQKELNRRLLAYDKLFEFVNDIATWDATCDSWYGLFQATKKQANELIKQIQVK